MTLGKKDKRVLKAFIEGKHLVGHKLSTDGERVDGHWLGGNEIAEWGDVKYAPYRVIYLYDRGSKAAQTVQRAIKKQVPASWIKEG
jgi:hypothetical protein